MQMMLPEAEEVGVLSVDNKQLHAYSFDSNPKRLENYVGLYEPHTAQPPHEK